MGTDYLVAAVDDVIRQIVREEVAAVAHPPRQAWTVEEFAAACGVSPGTVRNWLSREGLRAFRVGSVTRITDAEGRRFLAERSVRR